jgi:hypothetical protein
MQPYNKVAVQLRHEAGLPHKLIPRIRGGRLERLDGHKKRRDVGVTVLAQQALVDLAPVAGAEFLQSPERRIWKG